MNAVVYELGSSGEAVKQMQRALGEKLGLNITADGQLGRISQSALATYQQTVGIGSETNAKGQIYGPLTQAKLEPFIQHRYVQLEDLAKEAKNMGIELAAMRAVSTVEAKEFGFFKNGDPVILFERHKFYANLKASRGQAFADKTAAMRGDICNPAAGGYLGKEAELKRLAAAQDIDDTAALMSASWGLFQLMGFNHKLCGYANVQAFVKDMRESEDYQLAAFSKFVMAQPGMLNALKAKNWALFASMYNGKNYAINQYDKKLAAAYKLFA